MVATSVIVSRRDVAGDVDHPARQGHGGEIGKAPRQGLGMAEIHEPHAARPQEPLHIGCTGARHERGGLYLPGEQRIGGFGTTEREQPVAAATRLARGEQRLHEGTRAAALRADGNALAVQLVQHRQVGVTAVKHPERLVIERSQRDQPGLLRGVPDAPLHETDAHAGVGIREPGEILQRSAGGEQTHADAVAIEEVGIALGVHVIRAVLSARGNHELVRGRRPHVAIRNPERGHDDGQGCSGDHEELAERNALGSTTEPGAPEQGEQTLVKRRPAFAHAVILAADFHWADWNSTYN